MSILSTEKCSSDNRITTTARALVAEKILVKKKK